MLELRLLCIFVGILVVEASNYCGTDVGCECLKHRSLQSCVGLDLVSIPTFNEDTRDLVDSLSLQGNRIEFIDITDLTTVLPNLNYIDVSDQLHSKCVQSNDKSKFPSLIMVGFCEDFEIAPTQTTDSTTSTDLTWLIPTFPPKKG